MPRDIQDVHMSDLQYVAEPTPDSGKYKRISIPDVGPRHCLGYLEGTAASLTKSTRNDRKYVLQLWQNVENSEDFKEGMECAVIVGELDHPPERVDYSLSNGAVILTDWEIREDEGIVWARFAILDTPEGRKVMAYVKFKTTLGVSSRGLGDEIILNGETCIDPETYEFYCFDVVAFPAVKTARQHYIEPTQIKESVKKDKFAAVVTEQLNQATNKEELLTIKNVIESTNVPNKESLVESISHRLSSLSESADNQSNTGEEATEDASQKQILHSSASSEEPSADKSRELEATKKLLQRRGDNASYFRRVVQEQQTEINTLNEAVTDCLQSVSEVSTQLEDAKQDVTRLSAALKDSEDALTESRRSARAYKVLSERKIESLKREINNYRKDLKEARICKSNNRPLFESFSSKLHESEETITSLQTELAEEVARNIASLKSANSQSKQDADAIAELISQNKVLEEQLKKARSESSTAKSKLQENVSRRKQTVQQTAKLLTGYLNKCCEAYNVNVDAVKDQLPSSYTMEDVDRIVTEVADRQARFDMLPISLTPISGRVVEHKQHVQSTGNTFVVRALNGGK